MNGARVGSEGDSITRCGLLAGSGLLECFDELAEENRGRLIDQKMDVFWHDDVSVDAGVVPQAALFEGHFDDILRHRAGKERETPEATESDEV